MRSLIKIPIYVMVDTEKCDQEILIKDLSNMVEEFQEDIVFPDLSQFIIEHLYVRTNLVRIFTEPSIAQELLKKP